MSAFCWFSGGDAKTGCKSRRALHEVAKHARCKVKRCIDLAAFELASSEPPEPLTDCITSAGQSAPSCSLLGSWSRELHIRAQRLASILTRWLLISFWFIAHGTALRFFVLFMGVMSSLYSVWDIVSPSRSTRTRQSLTLTHFPTVCTPLAFLTDTARSSY